MGKRGKMNNLEIALDNISAAFREGEKAGITVKKDNWRDGTYATYEKEMKTMIRALAKMEGVDSKRLLPKYMNGSTWDKYFDHLAERYEQGTISGDVVQKRVHSLEAFRTMVNHTNVCGKETKIRVGDKVERLDYLKDRGVARSMDEVKAIKPSKEETKSVHDNFNTSTANGKASKIVNQFQIECGARIKSVFKLEVRDIDFEKKRITFRNDKNNFTRTVPMTIAAEKLLLDACHGKKPGTQVFALKDSKGNDMKIENAVKTVQKYTNDAAKKSGVNRENRRYSTHSNRKRFAQNLYDKTRYMSEKQIQKEIGNYIKMQGSNREQIVSRINTELGRINAYRKMKGLEQGGFSHEQLRRLYVSLQLGHSRIDFILRYIKADPKKERTS